jgi:hypothetical protein
LRSSNIDDGDSEVEAKNKPLSGKREIGSTRDGARDMEASNASETKTSRVPVPQDETSTCRPARKEVTLQDVGANDTDFLRGYMRQMWEANTRGGEVDVMDFRFALSFVEDLKPRNQRERALGQQMAMAHLYAMRFAQRLSKADNIAAMELYERIFTKMTRSYVAQLEAFNAMRNEKGPGVTVQNFSVKDVNQAIVGNINHSAGDGVPVMAADSPPVITDAGATPIANVRPQRIERVQLVRRKKT